MRNGHHLPSSLISESFSSLGDFDACLSLGKLPGQSVGSPNFYKGKYCLVHLITPQISLSVPRLSDPDLSENYLQHLSEKWVRMGNRLSNVNGICIPSLCSAKEITDLIETRTCDLFFFGIFKPQSLAILKGGYLHPNLQIPQNPEVVLYLKYLTFDLFTLRFWRVSNWNYNSN